MPKKKNMQSIRKNTKREGIKERIFLTLGLLILSRLGTFIPVPGVDHDAFYQSIIQLIPCGNGELKFGGIPKMNLIAF